MAKATITANPTPSQQVVAKASLEYTVTDTLGRGITIRKPGALGLYRLVEALGDVAKNQVYMAMVMPLIYVSKIDGEVVMPPVNKAKVEALIQRLEEEGLIAVSAGVEEHFGNPDPEADKETLKN
jgi:hypothetical protein